MEKQIMALHNLERFFDYLKIRCKKLDTLYLKETKRYWRIYSKRFGMICFVVKFDFENKTLGICHSGDVLYPRSSHQPAKHKRTDIISYSEWNKHFNEFGMISFHNH